MAALFGLGIDNLYVELDSNELPGLDGSSLGYLELFDKVGLAEQEKERCYFSLKDPIRIEEGGAFIVALPSSEFKISCIVFNPLPNARFVKRVAASDFMRFIIDAELCL